MRAVKIFLSYAREDEAAVQMLYTFLRAADFDPWMDRHAISGGEPWRQRIDEGLKEADFVVVCLSTHSVAKTGVLQEEIDAALEGWRKRGRGEAYVIPARLERCEVPNQLKHLQWVDLPQPDQWPVLVEAIRTALRRRRKKRVRQLQVASAVLLLIVLGALVWWQWQKRSRFEEAFRSLREGRQDAAGTSLGATIWKVSPEVWCWDPKAPKPGDRVRVSWNTTFSEGDKVRIGIEPGGARYVYVIDQAEYNGALQSPKLIFPSSRIRNGQNRFDRAGALLELPAVNEPPWCWTLERPEARRKANDRLTAEWLTIVTSPTPIPELSLPPNDQKVASYLSGVEAGAQVPVDAPGGIGRPPTQSEIDSGEGTKELTLDDPPPQTIFRASANPGRPFAIRLPLRIR